MSSEEGPQPLASDYIQLIYNAFCFFLGFPLNLVTLLRLAYRFKKTKNRIFLLHINLNISDLMVLLFYCFGRVCWLLTYQWMGGDRLCKLMRFLEALSFSISSNIVVCIGADRAHSVLRPLQASTHVTLGTALKIFFAWICSIAVALPQIFVWSVYSETYKGGQRFTQCVTRWTIKILEGTNTSADRFQETIYETIYLFGLFWVPLVILLISYIIILNSIFKNFGGRHYTAFTFSRFKRSAPNSAAGQTTNQDGAGGQQQAEENLVQVDFKRHFQAAEERRQQTRYRTLRVTVILLSLYVVCWLPYNTLGWWKIIDEASFKKISDRVYFLHGLVVLNSVVNPFVYGRFQLTNCCPTDEDIQNLPMDDDDDISSQLRARNSGRRADFRDFQDFRAGAKPEPLLT